MPPGMSSLATKHAPPAPEGSSESGRAAIEGTPEQRRAQPDPTGFPRRAAQRKVPSAMPTGRSRLRNCPRPKSPQRDAAPAPSGWRWEGLALAASAPPCGDGTRSAHASGRTARARV